MAALRKGRLKDSTAGEIEYWPIDQVQPHPRNSRTHSPEQIAAVRASFREFGWTYPILITPTGTILAGHARWAAAKAEGAAEAKVLIATGLSKRQIRAYLIADNQTAATAGWDEDVLKAELAALSTEGFQMEALGFDEAELERLMSAEALAAGRPTAADVPESSYKEQYGVIVICANEAEQRTIFDRLTAEGLKVRVVAT